MDCTLTCVLGNHLLLQQLFSPLEKLAKTQVCNDTINTTERFTGEDKRKEFPPDLVKTEAVK